MRTTMKLLAALFLVSGLVVGSGCGPKMTTQEAIANLKSPDLETRWKSADALRGGVTGKKVAPEAVAPLLDALKTEAEPKARGAILTTLGASGSPEAKPAIDEWVQKAASADEQRWYGRALKTWLIETGAKSKEDAWPDGWPYGTTGYPPIIPKG